MTTVRFKSYIIDSSIPLEKLTTFFRIERSTSWKEYIVLGEHHLEGILKKQCDSMGVYLFDYGCISFVNFGEFDMQSFLDFLAGLVDTIDYALIARFAESHTIAIDDQGEFHPWLESSLTYRYDESVIPLISNLLAKSTAMNKIEHDVDANLDESGKYIDYLRRGRLRFNKKALSVIVSKFLKFEYESISTIRIFDRGASDNNTLYGRELYDVLAEYYELNDRFDVLQSKIGSLRTTMKTYNSLSYRRNENRLYLFEIFLLGLFPLAGLVRLFFHL